MARTELQKLAAVLREARHENRRGYIRLTPEELAAYLLDHGYSRTAVTFDAAFEAAVTKGVQGEPVG